MVVTQTAGCIVVDWNSGVREFNRFLLWATQRQHMEQALSKPGLNPLAFLERSALGYPKKPAVIYGEQIITYAEFYKRVMRLDGSLYARFTLSLV